MLKGEMRAEINRLRLQYVELERKRADCDSKILHLNAAASERETQHNVQRERWREDIERLQTQLDAATVALRVLGVTQWGEKADANLQYSVYGDGGGGVADTGPKSGK